MKFGVGMERFDDALAAVARHDLVVDTIHFHAGSGWLADGLPAFERALPVATEAVERARAAGHPIGEVNVGGGIGIPAPSGRAGSGPGGLRGRHRTTLGAPRCRRRLRAGGWPVEGCGDPAGKVVSVEERRGVTFVGLDFGWNVTCAYFIYRFAQEVVVCAAAGAARTTTVTVAGPHQRGGRHPRRGFYPMPPVAEGDIVALLNAGGYHQAMSSTHCLRPMAEAIFLDR